MNEAEQSQEEIFEHLIITRQDFSKDDYVHLWEYFEGRADMLKDRLWTISTWLLGFNSIILSFIGMQLISFELSDLIIRSPTFVLALVLAGCIICLYARLLIKDYDKHIKRNWERACVLKEMLPLVKEAWAGESNPPAQQNCSQNKGLAEPAIHLYRFATFYLLLFLAVAVFTIIVGLIQPRIIN